MKRTLALLCLAALLLPLAGCGSPAAFDGSRTSDETGFYMEYAVLNRQETADLTLAAGEQLRVFLAHSAGDIDLTVGRPGKEPLYTGKAQANAEFVLTAPEDGVYRIDVTGRHAKGRVSFERVRTGGQ